MADNPNDYQQLSQEDIKDLYGKDPRQVGQDVQGARQEMQDNPIAVWWDMVTGGQNTAAGRLVKPGGRPFEETSALAKSLGLARNVPGADAMSAQFAARAQAPVGANPFDMARANQARAAQMQLLSQMQAAQQGPSLAAMQGQQGMAQIGQQALMRGGRAGMLGAQGGGVGMAADVGRARLAEAMRLQAGLGSTAGGLMGREEQAREMYNRAQLQQGQLGQKYQLGYADLANKLSQAQSQLGTDREVMRLNAIAKKRLEDMQTVQNFGNQVGSMVGTATSMSGGKK